MKACPAETGKWDGGFSGFAANEDSFCSHCGTFGVPDCAYTCAGGGASGGGGGYIGPPACAPSANPARHHTSCTARVYFICSSRAFRPYCAYVRSDVAVDWCTPV